MPPTIQPFTSDAPLFYNVGIWGERGYAIPNHGGKTHTVNRTIEEMVTEGGKRLSQLMHHYDVSRADPPSLNSITRMVELINRARRLLLTRAVPENEPKFEGKKIKSPRAPFKVFPFPFFSVDNRLMKSFAEAALATLGELMQSTEIAVEHDITQPLAQVALAYLARFQRDLAVDYFGMTPEAAKDPALDLSQHYAEYLPIANGFVSAEAFDDIGTISWPQELDLGPLAKGILVQELPTLGPYPYEDSANPTPPGMNVAGTGQGVSGTSTVPAFI